MTIGDCALINEASASSLCRQKQSCTRVIEGDSRARLSSTLLLNSVEMAGSSKGRMEGTV